MRGLARKRLIALLVSLLVLNNIAFAQEDENNLDPVRVANDLKSVKFVLGLLPIERHNINDLEKRFKEFPHKYTSWINETDLGFRGRRVKLSMGVGYTTLSIDYLLFNDQIVHYKLGARVSGGKWNFHGETIARTWRQAGGPEFKIVNGELVSAKEFPEEWQAYRSEIENQLGAIQPINVPPTLVKHYQLLTDRLVNSRISVVACDDGKPAIDALEDAKRVDLIKNVLRSYNPGGRVYAAISLLRMQGQGAKLNSATIRSIQNVVSSSAEVATCRGDTGIVGLLAKDVIPEYVASDEWYLLRR